MNGRTSLGRKTIVPRETQTQETPYTKVTTYQLSADELEALRARTDPLHKRDLARRQIEKHRWSEDA